MTTLKIYKKATILLGDVPDSLYHKYEDIFDDMLYCETEFDKLPNDIQQWLIGIDENISTIEMVELLE